MRNLNGGNFASGEIMGISLVIPIVGLGGF